jgi:hypothetical protein
MRHRHFLKLTLGFVGAAALATAAAAAPLSPASSVRDGQSAAVSRVLPAVTSGEEVERLAPQQVRWHRHWRWHHHRHWHRHHHWRRHW